MQTRDKRKGPDGLQKLFLYLILIEWFLLIYTTTTISRMTFRQGLMTLTLLLGFNLILAKLGRKRAKRSTDGYIIYPILCGGLLSFILLIYFIF
ncbi:MULTISPECIES: hypothetical protein [unclassified Shewanella]|uniref:hypothetical protein n=1 Tax=unclassified Shewanella TaxID=196818 RepID=UPI000C861798|nr:MULTISPECIES: hypothetical protein [unclassified Shewanella]MDO6679648.1 hypothetical protein [Shewanella sp. 4_MG-2023]PMH98576.1 hypothetical protein BCU55_15555 [Shewanella sp. 10N.286.48.A6]